MLFVAVDGGYRERHDYMGIGGVAFFQGEVVAEFSYWKEGGTSTDAELIAILHGLELAREMKYEQAFIATDSQSAIDVLNKGAQRANEYNEHRKELLIKINMIRDECPVVVVGFVNREDIQEAHELANRALERYRTEQGIAGLED